LGRNEIAVRRLPAGNNWKKLLPGLLISLICLAAVLYLIDLDKFFAAMRQARLALLLFSASLSVVWLLVRGKVWQTLLQNKVSYRDTFFTINEGYLLNNLLPFRLGELGRAYLLGRKAGLSFWQVLSTILVERALDLVMAAGLFLSTLPFVVGVTWARQAATVIGIVVAFGLLALYLVARNQKLVSDLVDRLAQRWKMARVLNGDQAHAFLNGLGVLTETKRFLTAAVLIILDWAINIFQYYLMLRAFFPQAQPLWAFFALGSAALGIAAPSSPGSLGVFEAVLVGALAVFGVEPSGAAAFAISMHFVMYASTSIFGVYALVTDGLSLTGLYRELGNIKDRGAS
jgi:uncharacterized protein (TIRG00374 family)